MFKPSHCNILYVLYAENSNSQKCIEYVRYKDVFKYEQYLSNVVIPKFRKALTCLRLSSHDLLIEKGRHINLPRHERLCTYCDLEEIEDEFHFTLKCPFYSEIRQKYLPGFYITNCSRFNFYKLMSETSDSVLMNNLARFTYYSFQKRKL